MAVKMERERRYIDQITHTACLPAAAEDDDDDDDHDDDHDDDDDDGDVDVIFWCCQFSVHAEPFCWPLSRFS